MTRPALLARLHRNRSGVAMLEFALMMPIFVTMCVGGTELANYITTRMRISQMALQIADNAARIGNGTKLSAKTVTESDINDLFAGADLESGGLKLNTNGRVILSDLEPMANTATNTTYKIGWQRCFGQKVHASDYGKTGDHDLAGMGPTSTGSTQTFAMQDGATMFVEIYYRYNPVISSHWVPSLDIVEVASMAVRDRRDLSSDAKNADGTTNSNPTHPEGIYKVANVTASTC